MPDSEKPKEPLATKDLIGLAADSCQIMQTLVPLLSSVILFMGTSLSLQASPKDIKTPNPEPSNTNNTVIININSSKADSPEVDVAFKKLQQVQNMLNTLNSSQDDKTLSKAREAIMELQELLTEKKAQLEQGKNQLNSLEAQNLSHEQLQLKKNIEQHLSEVQNEIDKLNDAKKRIEASQEAIEWLNPKKSNNIENLAKNSVDRALNSQSTTLNTISQENLQQFYWDIEDFLMYICTCLIVCRPNLIDDAVDGRELLRSSLPASFYIKTFETIRDEIAPSSIPQQAARKELTAYLDYLINKLS
jgi:small-conductance mechanosensitive channel